jgi:4,5-DOPA dioxygenase extradiol
MMPALFLAHGAPTFALKKTAATRFWSSLPRIIPQQPRAILCLSGHWETATPELSSSSDIQHDYYGFPAELYRLDWPLRSDPETAAWMRAELARLGVETTCENRALDHGVWVPLRTAWPEPTFPVFQLSLCPDQGAHWHVELGQKLAPLRKAGVLIIGSGGISHNLGRIDWQAQENNAASWAAEFMQCIENAIASKNTKTLCDPWQLAHGHEAVPTLDHYLPFLVILAMAGKDRLTQLHAGWSFGSLSMHSYGLGVEKQS